MSALRIIKFEFWQTLKRPLIWIGIVFMFYCCVVFTMIFDVDVRGNVYELLHSKKVKPSAYIISKALGFGAAVALTGLLMFTALNIAACPHCYELNLDFSVFAFYKYYFAWVVPSMLFVEAFIVAVTFALKSGIPAIPFLIMYIMAGTYPTTDKFGITHISQTFWNIMVRLSNNSGKLLQTVPESFYREALINKAFQGGLTVLLMVLSVYLYGRRKRNN